MFEELEQLLSRGPLERSRFDRRPHLPQPGQPLPAPDRKTRVRFPQAQMPAKLRLFLVAAEELDQERGERFGGVEEARSRGNRLRQGG